MTQVNNNLNSSAVTPSTTDDNMLNNLWYSINVLYKNGGQNPNSSNIVIAATAINDFMATYPASGNGPKDPKLNTLWKQLTATPTGGSSLATYASSLITNHDDASAMNFITALTPNLSSLETNISNAFSDYSGMYKSSNTTITQDDFDTLANDISNYQSNPTAANLSAVATAIVTVDKELNEATAPLDGFQAALQGILDTTSYGGEGSLAVLAADPTKINALGLALVNDASGLSAEFKQLVSDGTTYEWNGSASIVATNSSTNTGNTNQGNQTAAPKTTALSSASAVTPSTTDDNMLNNLWYSINVLYKNGGQNPNSSNIMIAATAINDFMATYPASGNGPTDPKLKTVWTQLTATPSGGSSLATCASSLITNHDDASALNFITSLSMNLSSLETNISNAFSDYSGMYKSSNTTITQDDFDTLANDISNYQSNPTAANLASVAAAIVTVDKELNKATTPLDGMESALQGILDTASFGGEGSLAALAADPTKINALGLALVNDASGLSAEFKQLVSDGNEYKEWV